MTAPSGVTSHHVEQVRQTLRVGRDRGDAAPTSLFASGLNPGCWIRFLQLECPIGYSHLIGGKLCPFLMRDHLDTHT